MAKTMLIDAAQSEETRVAVLDNNGRLEEFDLDITSKQQIKGDIYLAKVTRVEPSLQAAFVNFGGNRHGFLPFSEIHPDYYKIPVADREALQAEIEEILSQREANEDADEDEVEDVVAEVIAELEANDSIPPAAEDLVDEGESSKSKKKPAKKTTRKKKAAEDEVAEEVDEKPKKKSTRRTTKPKTSKAMATKTDEVVDTKEVPKDGEESPKPKKRAPRKSTKKKTDDTEAKDDSEIKENKPTKPRSQSKAKSTKVDKADAGDDNPSSDSNDGESDDSANKRQGGRRGNRYRRSNGRHNNNRRSGGASSRGRNRDQDDNGKGDVQSLIFRRLHRRYKIQEVIKRGQIVLVQATKEERGNKGAAMTSYLSLPGRYSVLMPNSPRSGGVSRKIFDRKERDRLKKIFAKLEIPQGMSAILRTAGVGQSATDIQRDYDYLQKTWGQIRETTMSSTAPAMIYQEGSVIKRAIRDVFSEEVGAIHISGKEALAEAKEFMGMLVPTQVDKIKEHKAKDPLFVHYKAEEQIAAIDNHTITLKSGGYLVFSPTEALVAIDINSGRSTRERHIEETALNTNLEAAEEIARQMRLRDLGGLLVIDFIDMEDHRHNVLVERKLEAAVAKDRARIQMSRISQFGLLEMSRQRLRPSLTESHFITCPTCDGQGMIRTTESAAVVILRAVAQECASSKGGVIAIRLPEAVCLYLLNNKRSNVSALEKRYDIRIDLTIDSTLGESQYVLEYQQANGGVSSKRSDDVVDTSVDHNTDKPKKAPSKRGRKNTRSRKKDDGNEAESAQNNEPAKDKDLTTTEEKPQAQAKSPNKSSAATKAPSPYKAKEVRDDAKSKDTKDTVEVKSVPAPEKVDPGYEVITEVADKPKKGWWRKVVS